MRQHKRRDEPDRALAARPRPISRATLGLSGPANSAESSRYVELAKVALALDARRNVDGADRDACLLVASVRGPSYGAAPADATSSSGMAQRRSPMKFFIDTADIKEIREAAAMGLVDGVTTNPSLVAKTGRKFRDVLLEICDIVKGPVSAEVVERQARRDDEGGARARGAAHRTSSSRSR